MGSAVATVIAATLSKDDYTDYILTCASLKKRLRQSCIENVVYGILYHGEPGKEYHRALQLCKAGELQENEEQICYEKVAFFVKKFYAQDVREAACEMFPQEYRTLCVVD